MKLSVVIPCYNCAKTVIETLCSVEGQNFGECEIVLINDGSTDDTQAILEAHVENNQKNIAIKLINQQNSGVSRARNVGIENSTGDYVLFLDADDFLTPGCFAAIHQMLLTFSYDVVAGKRAWSLEDMASKANCEEWCDIAPNELLKQYTISKKDFGISSFLLKKQVLDEYCIRFTEGCKYGEDWEFITKCLSRCTNAGAFDGYFFFCRVLETSVSRTMSWNQTDVIGATERVTEYLKANEYIEADWFDQYMYPRAIFSVAHRFARARDKRLYQQFISTYDVRTQMKRMLKHKDVDWKSRVAAGAYLLSPKLFYILSVR